MNGPAEFFPVKEYHEYRVRIVIDVHRDGRNICLLPDPLGTEAATKGHSKRVFGCPPHTSFQVCPLNKLLDSLTYLNWLLIVHGGSRID